MKICIHSLERTLKDMAFRKACESHSAVFTAQTERQMEHTLLVSLACCSVSSLVSWRTDGNDYYRTG